LGLDADEVDPQLGLGPAVDARVAEASRNCLKSIRAYGHNRNHFHKFGPAPKLYKGANRWKNRCCAPPHILHQHGIHKFSLAPVFRHRSNNAQHVSLLGHHTEVEAGQQLSFFLDNQ
jgi:hypothetical protein